VRFKFSRVAVVCAVAFLAAFGSTVPASAAPGSGNQVQACNKENAFKDYIIRAGAWGHDQNGDFLQVPTQTLQAQGSNMDCTLWANKFFKGWITVRWTANDGKWWDESYYVPDDGKSPVPRQNIFIAYKY
jgi:hypothetical protein